MRKPFLAALTIAALGLSIPFVAEAGPPVQSITGENLTFDDGCTATVTWDALNGGKPLFIHVTLQYFNGSIYTQVLADGAKEYHKAKQNAGIFQLDLTEIAGSQSAGSYQVNVQFRDRKDTPLSSVMSETSNCDAN
jgi:hypothetical protein